MPNKKKKKESKEMEMLKKMFEGKTPNRQNNRRRNPFVTFLLMVFLVTALYQVFGGQFSEEAQNPREKVAISQIQEYYKNGDLTELTVKLGKVLADTKDGSKLFAYKLPNETVADLGFNLKDNNTKISVSDIESDAFWGDLISSVLPILIILAIIIFLMRRASGGASGGFGFGMSRAKLFNKEDSKTKFKDVAGSEEAKEELVEVVDFLKKPKKYLKIGAKIPKGILLVGSPGTGKTLLARAVAGEAEVPFFSISGSEFIEMFVGVGASRVRDLFQKAKKLAPAIIFIDEIDAIGKQRGHGFGGGHDEREQTLNQILSEMDGFETGTNVIILAATNRPEVLDKALLRPGRFDRRVVIDKPDLQARTEILKVHSNKKPLANDVKLQDIAKKTSGFSGAELESVMNEAAIATAKANKKSITQAALFEAVEKVMMGPEKRSAKYLEVEKKITAYHEVGHALISHMIPECDPVHKISIIARGMSLGSTWYLPDEERRMYSKEKFLAEICSLLGGRLGEETKFGKEKITTGASNDFQRATSIARRMVMEYGMSPLGPIVFGEDGGGAYTGAEFGTQKNYSEETAQKIDAEVSKIINACLEKGRKILQDSIDVFEAITQHLLEKEVITAEEFEEFFKSKKGVKKSLKKNS